MTKGSDYVSDLQEWKPLPNATKEKIITWLYQRPDLPKIIRKIAKDEYLSEELTAELFLYLCNTEDIELIRLYRSKEIDFVILGWLKLQWHSTSSPFYVKIRKYAIGKAMTPEQEEKVRQNLYPDDNTMKDVYDEALDSAIRQLRSPGEYKFYHQDIIKTLLRKKTIKATAAELNIRPEYVSQAIRDAQVMLKPLIDKDVQTYLNNQITDL